MCGIAGSINFTLEKETVFRALHHRGPDGQGYFGDGQVELFSLRLAIQDREGGKQPMSSEGRFVLVFNGEIYNHRQLRKDHHLDCRSNADAETLLQIFIQQGASCLDLLDGMFAFAIFDRREGKLFFARDRAGEKPLYFFQGHGKFVFASELNCLASLLPLEIEEDSIPEYLRLGYFFGKNTPYKNVMELPAGHCAWLNVRTLRFSQKKWWDMGEGYRQSSNDSFELACERVEQGLEKSVRERLETSDLEVGTFLSGGIDSGLVTAMAAALVPKLKTFTASFEGAYDEAPLARKVAQRYGTDHHEIRLRYDQLPGEVEGIIARYGEPFFDSSAIPGYYVSRAAKEHVTVILTGDGADELFGGYRRYVPFGFHDFLKKNQLRQAGAGLLRKLLPEAHEKKSSRNYLNRLLFQSTRHGIGAWLAATQDVFEGFEENLIPTNPPQLSADLLACFDKVNSAPMDALKKMQWLDFETLLPGDFLVKTDIASMANSLELRSPFLGKEMLGYAPTLPSSFHVRGKTTKRVLRVIASKYLPGELCRQPKRGFEVPLKQWVSRELREVVHDHLSGPQAYFRQFVRPGFVHDLLEKRVKVSEEKRAKMIWSLFVLEVWYKHFKANNLKTKPLENIA